MRKLGGEKLSQVSFFEFANSRYSEKDGFKFTIGLMIRTLVRVRWVGIANATSVLYATLQLSQATAYTDIVRDCDE